MTLTRKPAPGAGSEHTPGPWALDRDEREHMEWNIEVVRANDRNRRICFMTSDGPSEANARLIAAAPDLLEVLQEILAADPIVYFVPSDAAAVAIKERAIAAIAKATGAAP